MTVPSPRPIIITGFMAAGKSTVARALARRLNCQMIDLDEIIAEREKRTVHALISDEGEERFREAETDALRVVLGVKALRVIALGGGAWTLERNRALIAEHDCFTVWLDAPFELCWRRITRVGRNRPLARDLSGARRLYDERRPLYGLAALRVRAAEGRSPHQVATEILRALRGRGSAGG